MNPFEGQAVSAGPPLFGVTQTALNQSYSERILVLTAPGAEAMRIAEVLRQGHVQVWQAASAEQFCAELQKHAGAALVTEEVLTPPVMKCLTELLARQDSWSDISLIVLFGSVGHAPEVALRMLDLLEPLGNVTLLERPLGPTALVSAIRSALRGRRRQYQVRDLLAEQEQALRQRQSFLSVLAHEVRNPLGAIRHANEILKRLGAPTNQAVEQRNVIARQTTRLAHLIDNLLDVSQLLLGKLTLHSVSLDLQEVIRRTLPGLRAELDARQVQLSYLESPDPLLISGEAERLRKVFEEVLTSALYLSAPGSRLSLQLSRQGEEAVVQVRSTDRAFAPALAASLREPTSEDCELLQHHAQPGMKIALALAGKILDLHRGSVSLAGDPHTAGSGLTIRFPVLPTAQNALQGGLEPVPAGGAPHRVLIVEDNIDARDTLQLLVQLWGHRVQVAGTAEQGIQRALKEQPDVALVDIGLPDVDGYEVARRLRASFGPRILLLAMTGYGPPHDPDRAEQAGFDVHLIKPVDPRTLAALLRDPDAARSQRLAAAP